MFFKEEHYNNWILAIQTGNETIDFMLELPPLSTIKKKCVLIFKGRVDKDIPITDENVKDEVLTMEMTRNIMENLFLVCQDVYMPVLSNPVNQVGWSDLVSKDLMDKFNFFLAQIYVTIG